ncbi:adenosylcobinamide-phosphate synthase CbiB [Fictibacillus terranigra]|uniref:Cobalamin biosynthesis protein CobD n=1 Tax=Fictibacillus terranigra TaxID=3058424 RepID=A0ABT8E2M6_9BACL|nr:adenosylcobinamide-phosphate synthase CbiB [Fictibacillus sp. CENA-BCM004]MDN4072157.1 adenosylcobinamide-phosphate synthase CbiB [Fictibacillus sp. CENA-BCM004]
MMALHLLSMLIALIIDQLIGDPRWLPHPVRGFGKLISVMDRVLNRGKWKKLKGSIMLFIILSITLVLTFIIVRIAYSINHVLGVFIESMFISTTIAARGLKEAGLSVLVPLKRGDVQEARKKLSWIVGRDTEHLPPAEIVRGAVETVAENTSDGITAPLFFAFIGGAPLALVYRAVNTCDSMVGYKNERYKDFGWASARFDDVLNYVPARLTALLMAAGWLGKKRLTLSWLKEQAKNHPSPNSGWSEAAVAGVLGIRLGGTNYYKGQVSYRPYIGRPIYSLKAIHIERTIAIMQRTVLWFTIVLIAAGGMYIVAAQSWS